MSMEDGTLRKLELYLHDLHKKIDGIYDMLMLRHECNLQIFLCLFLEKLNMPQNTPVTKAS